MSTPRCIQAGRTWMVTRRTTRRHFLLRPDGDGRAQEIYWYATAVLAKKFGIHIHAVQVLSTHMHEVLTDVHGNLPAFLRERNRALANALKVHRGWPEEVFQRAPANCVHLVNADAVLAQIGYTLANCVEAGLAPSPEEWPGPSTQESQIGAATVRVKRPAVYFDPNNPVWPDEVELPIRIPRVLLETYGPIGARERLRRSIRSAVERARAAFRAAGRAFKAVRELLTAPFTRRSRTFERFGSRVPTIASGRNREASLEARREHSAFLEQYRLARDALRQGAVRPAFPDGTWRWRIELLPPSAMKKVQCQSDPRSDLDVLFAGSGGVGALVGP